MSVYGFHGRYNFLSNFYETPVTYNGLLYGSSEAAFQAQKVTDEKTRLMFTSLDPSKSKLVGLRVHLRPDWEQVKDSVMEDIVRTKFTQHPDLAKKLISTGDEELVEANTWGDRYWGVDDKTGRGKNMLGKILMKVRDELC